MKLSYRESALIAAVCIGSALGVTGYTLGLPLRVCCGIALALTAFTMWLLREPPRPKPPQNVRVVHLDGRVTRLPVVYLGKRDGLVHMWEAVGCPALGPGDSIDVDVLPARTELLVSTPDDGSAW